MGKKAVQRVMFCVLSFNKMPHVHCIHSSHNIAVTEHIAETISAESSKVGVITASLHKVHLSHCYFTVSDEKHYKCFFYFFNSIIKLSLYEVNGSKVK